MSHPLVNPSFNLGFLLNRLTTDQALFVRRKAIQEKAKVERWVHQGMRHTFCSNWLAIHNDINKLVLQSGHTDVQTMWEAYHRGIKRTAAEEFWAIMPSAAEARKIIYLS